MSFKLNRRQFAAATLAAGATAATPGVTAPAFAIGPYGKGLRTVKQVFGASAGSLEKARRELNIARPASLSQMAPRFVEDLVFEQRFQTPDGVALGGGHKLTIQRDGSYTYSGNFRATGFPSYNASVVAMLSYAVPTPSGQPASAVAAFVAKGSVNGTNRTGDREYRWNQTGRIDVLESVWGSVRQGKFSRDFQYDADYFGLAGDVAGFVARLAAAGATFGAAGTAIMLAGEAANAANIRSLAVPEIVGVIAAGGAYYVLGPSMLVPAFIVGGAVGAAAIKQDKLSAADIALAKQVFGDTVPYGRVRKTNLLGLGQRPFAMVSPFDDTILINLGEGFSNSHAYTGNGPPGGPIGAPGQLLIHELAHAWQIAHSSWQPEFYCRAIPDAVAKNYAYGPHGLPWNELGNEQQATVVEEWFAGDAGKNLALTMGRNYQTHTGAQAECPQMATRTTTCGTKVGNPYHRYIVEHILARRP